jgi:hypothetical protein
MREALREDTPDEVKRQLLASLQAQLLPGDPSYNLQREVFLQHAASVGELGGEDASRLSKRPRETRSAVVLSGVPSKKSKASFREYQKFTGCTRESAALHAHQRDEKVVTDRGSYQLVRKVEEDPDRLYYDVKGLEYWLRIADPQNLGNQKYNKAPCSQPFHISQLSLTFSL